jgi:hypothetical protein
MKKYEMLFCLLASFSASDLAVSGELCQKHNIEYVTNEAGKYTHLAKDILFKYDYYAKELLARHPTAEMEICVNQLLAPLIDLNEHIAANKAYDDLEGCEKFELISMVAKAFTRKYANGQPSYFNSCLQKAPVVESAGEGAKVE